MQERPANDTSAPRGAQVIELAPALKRAADAAFAKLSPRAQFERIARACTEGGVKALSEATELSRAGDVIGAECLRGVAGQLFDQARAALNRLHCCG